MKSLKDMLVEARNDITWDDFYYTLQDYVYDNGEYRAQVGKDTLTLKDVFGSDYKKKCTSNSRKTLSYTAEWIYPLNLSGREIGIQCGRNGFVYVSNILGLIDFFGKDTLLEIYKYIGGK